YQPRGAFVGPTQALVLRPCAILIGMSLCGSCDRVETQPMTKPFAVFSVFLSIVFWGNGCSSIPGEVNAKLQNYTLDYETPVDPALQTELERIDADLRAGSGMTTEQTAVGVLDLKTLRLAMIH